MHATETTYPRGGGHSAVGLAAIGSLTRETNWTKVFGRLNGVYPRAAFHKTVKAMYWIPNPSLFNSGHMLRG